MKRTVVFICRAVLAAVILGAAKPPLASTPEQTIGLISKVIQDVSRKIAGKTWEKAERGQTLASGDMVRTGAQSLAIIKFKDNSLVRLRERSELTVTGTMTGSSFSKSVEIQTGVVGFNIQKQKAGEEFRFTTPTSVASIRGTSGAFGSSDTSDILTLLDGGALLLNRMSNRSATIMAGSTGISLRNGTILTRISTPDDRRAAQEALQDEQRKRLEIDLQGPQGKPNRLHIEYKE